MRNGQSKSNVYLYSFITLSIFLSTVACIFAIYTNNQLNEQMKQLEFAASTTSEQTNARIHNLELKIEALESQQEEVAATTSETETESEAAAPNDLKETESDTKASTEPREAPPENGTKPVAAASTSTEAYTIKKITTEEDGTKSYYATSNETKDGSVSFGEDDFDENITLKKGDIIETVFEGDAYKGIRKKE